MNVLARKLSTHLFLSSPPSVKRLIYLHPITVLQQCNFATRTPRTSTKGPTISRPQIQKYTETSPILIKKQTEPQTPVWPKPSEIPFQAKVANFVNLIGYVKIPVQFESDSEGKRFAATVISVRGGGGRKPSSIPVLFEGDLADIVACHVKENDSVFVCGQLCVEPLRLLPSENLGKFHVIAENLNFVEGFQKVENEVKSDHKPIGFPAKKIEILENGNAEKVGVSKKKTAEEIWHLWRDLVNNPQQWWDYRQHKADGLVKEKFPDFKKKESGESLWMSTAPKWVFPGLGNLDCDVKDLTPKQVHVGEFKNVGLGKPGYDVKDSKSAQVQVKEFKNGRVEDSWKDLVENPNKWWDNRVNKKNPRGPDFKHKETGEALWLGRGSPRWVLSKLPPV